MVINTPTSNSYTFELPLIPLVAAAPQIVPEGFSQEYSASFIARSAELLENQLRRSKDADLVVTIRTGPYPDYGQPFLRVLLPHLHRATHIRAPYHILADLHLKSPLSRLQHLYIDYSYGKEGSSPEGSDAQLHSPHPTRTFSATLSGRRIISNHTPLAIYRPDLLTRLDVNMHSCWEAVYPILPQMTNLMDMELIDGPEMASPLGPFGAGHAHGHGHPHHHHHHQQIGPAGRIHLPTYGNSSSAGRID